MSLVPLNSHPICIRNEEKIPNSDKKDELNGLQLIAKIAKRKSN